MRRANGEGSVNKRSGNRRKPYCAVVTISYESDDNNQKRQKKKSIGCFETEQEAIAALEKYNNEKYFKQELINNGNFQQIYDMFIKESEEQEEIGKDFISKMRFAYGKCEILHKRKLRDINIDLLHQLVNNNSINAKYISDIKQLLNRVIIYSKDNGILPSSYSLYNADTGLEYSESTLDEQINLELKKIDSMNGYNFERWCGSLLKELGFTDICITSESGDDGADIIAVKDEIEYAIQAKRSVRPVGNKAVQEVNTAKAIYQTHVAVVITNNEFQPSAVKAARATKTLLWDRTKIKTMLADALLGKTNNS